MVSRAIGPILVFEYRLGMVAEFLYRFFLFSTGAVVADNIDVGIKAEWEDRSHAEKMARRSVPQAKTQDYGRFT